MNKLLLPLILLAAWLIFGSLYLRNRFCGATPAAAPAVITAPTSTNRLLIEDGTSFKTAAAEHFDFSSTNFNYQTPLGTGVDASLQQTATYLTDNPNRSLMITGLYKESEGNESVFPTLGVARANEVKKAFIELGVSGKQLLTNDKRLPESSELNGGILESGVDFSFTETTMDISERLAAIKARFDANPVTIYFPTGEQIVALTPEQKQDFTDLVFYLDNVKGSRLEVGGHTDNKGELKINTRLSRKRAEFVRDYLTGSGLDRRRLTAKGYGPDAPIDSNDTKAGRAKNRLVEVLLR
ncbi:MAG: OmpA family protein [Bacteroidota bacterium]